MAELLAEAGPSDPYPYKVPLRNANGEILHYAYVSEEDYQWVKEITWHRNVSSTRKDGSQLIYAQTSKDEKMHRMVFRKAHPEINLTRDMKIDHKDRNGLNNCRDNLRLATSSQNSQNKSKVNSTTATSRYIGVYYDTEKEKYIARGPTKDKSVKYKYLGAFSSEDDAGRAYDKYILVLEGKDSSTNGLVNYDDVKYLTLEDVTPQENNTARELPKWIWQRKNGTFTFGRKFDGEPYSKTFKTIEEAVAFGNEVAKEIEAIINLKLQKHMNKEIVRNDDNLAVIPIKDKEGNIVKHMIVDDDKWHELTKYSWTRSSTTFHACTPENHTMSIRNYLFPDLDSSQRIRHINNNLDDYRVCNLEVATDSVISHNTQRKVKKNTTPIDEVLAINMTESIGHRGVIKASETRWVATIKYKQKTLYVGSFTSQTMAAIAYNIKAKELHKESAYQNPISEEDMQAYENRVRKIMTEGPEKSSLYNGVSYQKSAKGLKKWRASVSRNKKSWSKEFMTEIEAAYAYNLKVMEMTPDNPENLNILTEEELATIPEGFTIETPKSKYKNVIPKNGKWSYQFRAPENHPTKYISKSGFATEKDAARTYNEEVKRVYYSDLNDTTEKYRPPLHEISDDEE